MYELSLFFEITDECNQRCSFCCKTWRSYGSHSLSYSDLDKILSIPKTHGKISGGEPSLAKEKVFYYIDRETCPVSLNTNLSNWTKEDMDYLVKKEVSITANIPSLRYKIHNQVTKSTLESFKNIKNNLKFVNPHNTCIALVVNSYTVNSFIDDMMIFYQDYGIRNFLVSPMIYNKKQEVDYDNILPRIESCYKNHRNINIRTVGKIKDCIIPPSHPCGAGKYRLVVLSNKDVVPCAWNNTHILGNLDTDSIETLRERGIDYYNSFSNEEKSLCKGYLENI